MALLNIQTENKLKDELEQMKILFNWAVHDIRNPCNTVVNGADYALSQFQHLNEILDKQKEMYRKVSVFLKNLDQESMSIKQQEEMKVEEVKQQVSSAQPYGEWFKRVSSLAQ